VDRHGPAGPETGIAKKVEKTALNSVAAHSAACGRDFFEKIHGPPRTLFGGENASALVKSIAHCVPKSFPKTPAPRPHVAKNVPKKFRKVFSGIRKVEMQRGAGGGGSRKKKRTSEQYF
jgi:hypothetical protein